MYKRRKLKWDICAMNAADAVRFEHPACCNMPPNQWAQSLLDFDFHDLDNTLQYCFFPLPVIFYSTSHICI